MKKVLFFIPTLGAGGAERALVKLVNNLPQDKYDISVKSLFNTGIYINELNKNISYSYVFKRAFKGNVHIFKIFSPSFLYKIMIREDYDVIVSYLEGPTTRIASGCNDKNTKLINWVHTSAETKDVFLSSYRNQDEFKKCSEKYNKTVFVAKTAQDRFEQVFPNISINPIVIYNPFDREKILNRSKEESDVMSDDFNIVSIGRLMPVKGFERLIKAISKINSRNVHLYIIGEGSLRNFLQEEIDNNGLKSKVTLVGFRENPYPMLKESDLYVCSSHREGYSTTVVESLVLGVPVLTTNCSGMTEILGENQEFGMIVDNNDEALIQGLERILNDNQLYAYYKEMAQIRGLDFELMKSVEPVDRMLENI